MITSSFILTGIITASRLTQPVIAPFPAQTLIATALQVTAFHVTVLQLRRAIVHLKRHLGPTTVGPSHLGDLPPTWLLSCGGPRKAPSLPWYETYTRPRCVPQRARGVQCPVVRPFKASSSRPASALHVGTPCAPAWAVLGEAWSCSSHLGSGITRGSGSNEIICKCI